MANVRAGREGENITFGERVLMTDDLSPISDLIAGIDGPILFFNVGTDMVLGDMYGPLVGTLLSESQFPREDAVIVGTLNEPVHATNIAEKINDVKRKFRDHTTLALDAAVGEVVGRMSIEEGMLVAGRGTGKNLPPIGDYTIMAVTCPKYVESTIEAMSYHTRGSLVYSLARRTTDAIVDGLRRRQHRLQAIKVDRTEVIA